jgi:hypothetical protein
MHIDPAALLSCIHDTLETFLADHPGCEAAEIEVARDGSSDSVRIEAGGCDFLLVLLPWAVACELGFGPSPLHDCAVEKPAAAVGGAVQ